MTCVCSLAGTSACASCFYNPNGTRQANNFTTWGTRAEMGYKDALILLDEMGLSERTCHIVEYSDAPIPVCSECGAVQPEDYMVYYCWSCGAKVVGE